MKRLGQGITFALLLLASEASFAGSADTESALTVQVEGIRADKGVVRVSLFSSSSGYPGDYSKAVAKGVAAVKGGKSVFTFKGLRPGTYAVSSIHDENNDGKLNLNWLGIPKEGTAASNNAKGTFGPPSFKDASFQLSSAPKIITVRMRYL
jgi:uncharacterized protein (DUF2141 family)